MTSYGSSSAVDAVVVTQWWWLTFAGTVVMVHAVVEGRGCGCCCWSDMLTSQEYKVYA